MKGHADNFLSRTCARDSISWERDKFFLSTSHRGLRMALTDLTNTIYWFNYGQPKHRKSPNVSTPTVQQHLTAKNSGTPRCEKRFHGRPNRNRRWIWVWSMWNV